MTDFSNFPAALADYAIIFPAALLCFLPMKNQLRFGIAKTLRYTLPALLFSLGLLAWMTCFFDVPTNTFFFPFMVIFYFAYHKSLTVMVSTSLSVFAYVCALMAIISHYATMFDALLHPDSGANTFSLEGSLFQVILSTVIVAIAWYPTIRFGSLLVDSLNMPRVWYTTLILSIIFLAISVFIRPLHYETLYTNNVFLTYIIVVSMMLITQSLLTVGFYFIVSGLIREREVEERNRMLEMQEAQYIKQQEYIKNSSAARHDFRQSIRILRNLAEEGDLDTIREYLNEYDDQLPQNETIFFTDNITINALLNYYHETSLRSGIRLHWDIRMPQEIRMSDVDLCNIIGNLLENAIAACREVPQEDRYIALSVTTEDDDVSLCIVMTNPYAGSLRKIKDRYLSTRRSGSGIGLSSVRSIAERYAGIAEFSDENGIFRSDVMVML